MDSQDPKIKIRHSDLSDTPRLRVELPQPSGHQPAPIHESRSTVRQTALPILAAALSIALVGLLVWRPWSSTSTVGNIERVLREDVAANAGATSVGQVASRMRAINTTGCPRDFAAAYLTHVHAWETMAEVEREIIAFHAHSQSGEVMAEAFIRGFLGDPFGKVSELAALHGDIGRRAHGAQQQIRVTFQDVERVAVNHGARLQRSSED